MISPERLKQIEEFADWVNGSAFELQPRDSILQEVLHGLHELSGAWRLEFKALLDVFLVERTKALKERSSNSPSELDKVAIGIAVQRTREHERKVLDGLQL